MAEIILHILFMGGFIRRVLCDGKRHSAGDGA